MDNLRRFSLAFAAVLMAALAASALAEAEKPLLWQIGKQDKDTREFALAPGNYAGFQGDGFFVVGQSDPKRDWPYVHPGPTDAWAGSRPHTFTIVFGLKSPPKEGACRLLFDLADTQQPQPPALRIEVNGKAFTHECPPGGGDDSVRGQPAKGKQHKFDVAFPASLLRPGTNEVAITTRSGSWILYDWIGMEAPAGLELVPVQGTGVHSIRSAPLLVERAGKLCQTVQLSLRHFGEPGEATVRLGGADPVKLALRPGEQNLEVPVAAVEKETAVTVAVEVGGKTLASQEQALRPVRRWVVYLIPHSHVDIGYTHVQTDVERAQWRYIEQSIDAARKTADYPPEARFKWNVEVLWAVDSYLRQASPEKQKEFVDAVKAGTIGLEALYGNELTALCRPEELVRLVRLATRLGDRTGVPVDTAMISDVPGLTWGLVPVLAQAGVKYISDGPNGGDRIGFTLAAWQDKPFWWVSPSGGEKVLVWIPYKGYWRAFSSGDQCLAHLEELERTGYPYDLVQMRYCLGDNAAPDPSLSKIVKDWNAAHAYPKLIIATASEMCRDFDKRYGAALPQARGDFTPYWEDGAASSARETAINREAAERLSQAEALWAMLAPRTYPAADFDAAWRNAVLYDEHTWGAHNSISQPEAKFVLDQWKIKQAFALDADKQSRTLLAAVLGGRGEAREAAVDVFNTASWPRTDLVVLAKEMATAGDRVNGPDGQPVSSQRLTTGELAFVARDVPPLGAKRYSIVAGKPPGQGGAKADGAALASANLAVKIDEKTGAIVSLKGAGIDADLAAAKGGVALNDYLYVPGKDPKDAKRCGPVKISVKEPGPLVASLLVESDAPGCNKLTREIRVCDGLDRVDIINIVDKKAVREKEGVHFGFAFNVPEGVMRMDLAWAVARPEADQTAGACKNWFTVQRWVDVSNADFGVTLAAVDAPLVEVGSITAETPWIEHLKPSQTLYSYVMNNYWHTNYKAYQDGPTVFRYSLRPHKALALEEAARFGIGQSQPLVAAPAAGEAVTRPRPRVEPAGVIAATLKPSDDGKALIVRLFGASGKAEKATLAWSDPAPKAVSVSDISEKPGAAVTGPVDVPPFGLVTIRAELP